MDEIRNDGPPDAGRPGPPGRAAEPDAARDEAALRDERQTERQAPDNASPGESAAG